MASQHSVVRENLRQLFRKICLDEGGRVVDSLLGTAGVECYGAGDLVALGCQRLRVLERGSCEVLRGGRKLRTLRPGHFFGPDLKPDERTGAKNGRWIAALGVA